jgi:uncharacterized membrane protein
MGPRTRRALACLGIVVFLAVYTVVAVTVSAWLPNLAWLKLAYFCVVGVAWGVPLLPLLSWAERGGKK